MRRERFKHVRILVSEKHFGLTFGRKRCAEKHHTQLNVKSFKKAECGVFCIALPTKWKG